MAFPLTENVVSYGQRKGPQTGQKGSVYEQ